jgi:hypothetical protein
MRSPLPIVAAAILSAQLVGAQPPRPGVRGEAEAIAEARAMVESMGGVEIWSRLESVHFVHEWHLWNRVDSYVENEILDLTGPRSWVEMRSEIYHRLRAYSPEHRYWNVVDGDFAFASDEDLRNAMERAPFNLYRVARGVAAGDSYYEIRFGQGDLPRTRQLDLYGPDGERHGWIVLNARKEPLVWATTQYRYSFGPMRRYGNLRVPAWGVTGNGAVSYEMVSLTGSSRRPDLSLFAPPPATAPGGGS